MRLNCTPSLMTPHANEEPIMFTAYVLITVIVVILNLFSAICDFLRWDRIVVAMRKAGVPESWLSTLGAFKTAGAFGLLLGFRYPLLGSVASIGIMLFFICAIVIHLRARDTSFGLALTFLLFAIGSFVLELQVRGLSAWSIAPIGF